MMKTRWTGSMSLLFALLAALLIFETSHGQIALADEVAPDKADREPQEEETTGPKRCPTIPIAVYGGGSLYEALEHADETCPSPTPIYVFGVFNYPQTCPACTAYKDTPQRFYGLAMPVPADYEHKMPAGKPRKYSKKALTPNRVRHLYLDEQRVYVKVFSFVVNRVDMANGTEPDDANFKETIHFAFECSDPASIGADPAKIDVIYANAMRKIPDPRGAPATVYDVTYEFAGGKEHILTFTCGDPEPPTDIGTKPTPADQTPTPAAQ